MRFSLEMLALYVILTFETPLFSVSFVLRIAVVMPYLLDTASGTISLSCITAWVT